MESFTQLSSRAVRLLRDNIDTDQIIPARFLKVTSRDGLGASLFADWRYDATGAPIADFILNAPESAGRQVLVAGDNFGSGSSREHAPWALLGFGFRVVIARSFADIFRNNALKNGVLPVVLEASAYEALLARLETHPEATITTDLSSSQVSVEGLDGSFGFSVDEFARHCLLQGIDQLGYLQGFVSQVEAYEAKHAAR